MPTIRCPSCSAENEESPGGAPFFCRSCHTIVDPSGKRKPTTPMPASSTVFQEGPKFVSQYGTTELRDRPGPGPGFAVGGWKPLGYLLAAVAAAVVGGGLAWVGLQWILVPILPSAIAGWAIQRALAAGSGGGTPDRGAIGSLVLLAIVIGTFAIARYVEYRAVERAQSKHVVAVFGEDPLSQIEESLFALRQRDPEKDGHVEIPEDGTTVSIEEEEHRLRSAAATGKHAANPYDVLLLAETGQPGFLGHLRHVVESGMTFRWTADGPGHAVSGALVVVWWLVELAVLLLIAFARVD